MNLVDTSTLKNFTASAAASKIIEEASAVAKDLGFGDDFQFKIMAVTKPKVYPTEINGSAFDKAQSPDVPFHIGSYESSELVDKYGIYLEYQNSSYDPILLMRFENPVSIKRFSKSPILKEDLTAIISKYFNNQNTPEK